LNLATWRLPSVGIDYRTEIEDEEPSLQTRPETDRVA
jgi:hypothetical protein